MKVLEGKELEQENDYYNMIFGEQSSDDEFSLASVSDKSPDSAAATDEEKEYSEPTSPLMTKKRSRRDTQFENSDRRKSKEDEFYELDMLDIDKIDELEEMKEKGISHDNINDEISHEDHKKTFSAKKNKSKAGRFLLNETNEKQQKFKKSFIENEDEEDQMKKRKRVHLSRKSKEKSKLKLRDNLLKKNKNVTAPRDNPDVIIINKAIFEEKPKDSEEGSEQEEPEAAYDVEAENKKTENFIKKFRRQEKEGSSKLNYVQDKLSQRDFLYEAIFTEWYNIQSLQEMQRLEELNKREHAFSGKKQFTEFIKVVKRIKMEGAKEKEEQADQEEPNKAQAKGRQENLITFSNSEAVKKLFENFNQKPESKEKNVCAVTGGPAKYFDPLTKEHYSDIESFKILRERYFQKEEDGLLFRIQTLSDLASQKKEKLKKLILTSQDPTASKTSFRESKSLINMVSKYGILKGETNGELEKRGVNRKRILILERVYNRNRENCVNSGMLIGTNEENITISKKIFKDKYSNKITGNE